MHHDENTPRHPHHRDPRYRREQHHDNFDHDQNFNDFKSRWGEPSPPLYLHQDDEWQPRNLNHFDTRGSFRQQREEWLPNQRRPYQSRHQHQDHQHRDISWRQRDVNFDSDNQRAEDRWQQDDSVQHPDDSRRRRRGVPDDDRYREESQRNRNHR